LLQASAVAKQHGVDILIDGVLNVSHINSFWRPFLRYILNFSHTQQHKLGGDRIETFPAVPVDPDNRLRDIGRMRDIDVIFI
jgi:alpha-amylase